MRTAPAGRRGETIPAIPHMTRTLAPIALQQIAESHAAKAGTKQRDLVIDKRMLTKSIGIGSRFGNR
ncbi:putative dead/deah box helicase domain protein [Burkholderiales bacterium GJ-E10]|nr:putative dead/deah box helicase domain protein [Burkholderiales bacterium GJ-E10]